jgi:transcriptional regulator GlxA family with amidase domain
MRLALPPPAGSRHTGPMRQIWIAVFPDVQVLDVTGPLEVFSIANRLGEARTPGYAVSVVAATPGPVTTSSGLALVAQRGLARPAGALDTLLVAGA